MFTRMSRPPRRSTTSRTARSHDSSLVTSSSHTVGSDATLRRACEIARDDGGRRPEESISDCPTLTPRRTGNESTTSGQASVAVIVFSRRRRRRPGAKEGAHGRDIVRAEQGELAATVAPPPDRIVTFPCLAPQRPLVDLEARQHRKGFDDPSRSWAATSGSYPDGRRGSDRTPPDRTGNPVLQFHRDHDPVAHRRVGYRICRRCPYPRMFADNSLHRPGGESSRHRPESSRCPARQNRIHPSASR